MSRFPPSLPSAASGQGWRLGYLVAPAEELRAYQKMQQSFSLVTGENGDPAHALGPRKREFDSNNVLCIYLTV